MCQLPHHAAPARFLKAIGLLALVALASALLTGLLVNIYERKAEARRGPVRLVEVGEDDTDPAHWGINWPRQYDSYKRTAEATRTRFGGHGGSEALPAQKIERDPWLRRMFLGYAFSLDYRDRRGHAYMLYDQEQTERQSKPQSGSCLHCHASIMPLYRQLGDGDAIAGFEQSYAYSYRELNQMLHDTGHAHPVSCVDCHDPATMELRITRPGFIQGIQMLASARAAGAEDEDLAAALALQRKAQWRLDFVAAENSMGFHAPQEAARILGEAADYARQGQIAAIEWLVEARQPMPKDKP